MAALILIPVFAIISIFIGINLPLIAIDIVIKTINIFTGADLVRLIVYGVDSDGFSINNIFFIFYITCILIGVVVMFVIVMINLTKQSWGFADQSKFNKRDLISWPIIYFFGIFCIPLAVFVINLTISSLVPLFQLQILDKVYFVMNQEELNKTANGAINVLNTFTNDINQYINYINFHINDFKEHFGKYEIIKYIDELEAIVKTTNELKNYFNGLQWNEKDVSNIEIIYEQSQLLLNKFNETINKYSKYLEPFDSETTRIDLQNQFNLLFLNNGYLKINDLISYSGSEYHSLNSIIWNYSNKYYKVETLTRLLTKLVLGRDVIISLWNPFEMIPIWELFKVGVIPIYGAISFINKTMPDLIFRLVFGGFMLGGVAWSIITILLKIFKKTFLIAGLMITSSLFLAKGISDNGNSLGVWFRKTLSHLVYVIISTFALTLFQIIVPLFIEWINSLTTNDDFINTDIGTSLNWKKASISLFSFIAVVGTSIAMMKLIDLSTDLFVGEQDNSKLFKAKASGSVRGAERNTNRIFKDINKNNSTNTTSENTLSPALGGENVSNITFNAPTETITTNTTTSIGGNK